MAVTLYPIDSQNLSEQDHLILKVLRLHYEEGLSQSGVSSRLGFSAAKVSRLIAEGHRRGLVKIEIAQPAGDYCSLEIALEDRYGLLEARVVGTAENRQSTDLAAGVAAGEILSRLCNGDTSLGVSWGRSLRALADALPQRAFACGKVVPLVGGMGRVQSSLHANQLSETLARKLGTESLYLTAPAIVGSPESREELMRTAGIKETIEVAARCDVAVVGIGGVLPGSTIVQAGYFTLEGFLGLRERGVAGDLCCHFLSESGDPCCPELSEKIVGLSLRQLKEVPQVLGIASGPEKALAVDAALKGGYLNSLVCDRELAGALLELDEAREEGEAV